MLVKLFSYEILYLKNQSQNIIFVPSVKLYFEFFSSGPTIVDPIVDSGYEGMCKTPANFAHKTLVKWLSYEVLHLKKQSKKNRDM